MKFSRPEHWSGPFPSQRDLPNPGIEPGSPAMQADSLPAELSEKTDSPAGKSGHLDHGQGPHPVGTPALARSPRVLDSSLCLNQPLFQHPASPLEALGAGEAHLGDRGLRAGDVEGLEWNPGGVSGSGCGGRGREEAGEHQKAGKEGGGKRAQCLPAVAL